MLVNEIFTSGHTVSVFFIKDALVFMIFLLVMVVSIWFINNFCLIKRENQYGTIGVYTLKNQMFYNICNL